MPTSKGVRGLPYERVVMDLDLDDAGVATGADVNVDKRLPDAKEEYDKQEGEEDDSSMKSVPYYYKNADYYYYLEEYEDDEDEDSKEGDSFGTGANVNVDKCLPAAEEEREGDASSMNSDVDYYYSEEDEGHSYSEEDEDNSFDSAATEKRKETISTTAVPVKNDILESLWKAYCDSHGIKKEEEKRAAVIRPQLEDWVDSWKVNNHHQTHFVWVNVYAYYSKDKHYGGYGVILRDPVAKPITASANFSASGVSFYTQVLMGIKAGVALADKHGLSELRVRCNSIKVPGLVFKTFNCRRVKCRTADDSRICNDCRQYYSTSEGCSLSLVPHLREIKVKTHGGQLLRELAHTGLNRAACYLAKMGKKDRPKVDNRIPPGDEEIKPDDFPDELKSILWEDAFDLEYYNESWLMDMATKKV